MHLLYTLWMAELVVINRKIFFRWIFNIQKSIRSLCHLLNLNFSSRFQAYKNIIDLCFITEAMNFSDSLNGFSYCYFWMNSSSGFEGSSCMSSKSSRLRLVYSFFCLYRIQSLYFNTLNVWNADHVYNMLPRQWMITSHTNIYISRIAVTPSQLLRDTIISLMCQGTDLYLRGKSLETCVLCTLSFV